jgi:tetratricopeptide (TPR) repeat protein
VPERRDDFQRALDEYEELADVFPSEREGLVAQLNAARILLKRLSRPNEALRFYEAASSSMVPHLDFERDIQSGIKEAKAAMLPSAASVT